MILTAQQRRSKLVPFRPFLVTRPRRCVALHPAILALSNLECSIGAGIPHQRTSTSLPRISASRLLCTLTVSEATVYTWLMQVPSTLVPEPISGDYEQFMLANHITHVQIHVPANKEGSVNITQETMDEVLSTMLAHNHEPVLIHCNRGKVSIFGLSAQAIVANTDNSTVRDVRSLAFVRHKVAQIWRL